MLAVEVSGARGEDDSVCVDDDSIRAEQVGKHDFDVRACRGVVESARVGVNKTLCFEGDMLVGTHFWNPVILLVPLGSPSRDIAFDSAVLEQSGVTLEATN